MTDIDIEFPNGQVLTFNINCERPDVVLMRRIDGVGGSVYAGLRDALAKHTSLEGNWWLGIQHEQFKEPGVLRVLWGVIRHDDITARSHTWYTFLYGWKVATLFLATRQFHKSRKYEIMKFPGAGEGRFERRWYYAPAHSEDFAIYNWIREVGMCVYSPFMGPRPHPCLPPIRTSRG